MHYKVKLEQFCEELRSDLIGVPVAREAQALFTVYNIENEFYLHKLMSYRQALTLRQLSADNTLEKDSWTNVIKLWDAMELEKILIS